MAKLITKIFEGVRNDLALSVIEIYMVYGIFSVGKLRYLVDTYAEKTQMTNPFPVSDIMVKNIYSMAKR